MMGGWASGVLKRGQFEEGKDFLCGPAPSNSGKPVFDMNADGLIFWDTKNPDYAAGQKIAAKVAMSQEFNKVFTQINGSIPVRSDIDLSDPAYQPCQRDAKAQSRGRRRRGPGCHEPWTTIWRYPMPPRPRCAMFSRNSCTTAR